MTLFQKRPRRGFCKQQTSVKRMQHPNPLVYQQSHYVAEKSLNTYSYICKVQKWTTNKLTNLPMHPFLQETGVTLIWFGILGFQEFFTDMSKPPKNDMQPNLTFLLLLPKIDGFGGKPRTHANGFEETHRSRPIDSTLMLTFDN